MTVLLRLFVSRRLEEQAREHAQQADAGHEHHGREHELSWRQRLTSADAWTDVAQNFRGDWPMLWKEIAIGFLLAGFIGLLGNDFFNGLFVTDAPARLQTARERDRRAADRRPQLRLLDRQRAAGGGVVVRRDQLRRGDPVRRPDRRRCNHRRRTGNAITPAKLIPPDHNTAASGTLPIEHTKLSTAMIGPTITFSASFSPPAARSRRTAR